MTHLRSVVLSIFYVGIFLSVIDAQRCPASPVISTPANTAEPNIPFNNSNISIYNSAEVGPDNGPNRAAADTFDDAWRSGSTSAGLAGFSTPWSGGAAGTFVNGTTLFTFGVVNVSLSSVNMDSALETGPHPCAGTSLTGDASLTGAGGTSLQDSSPRPAQLAGAGTYLDPSLVGSSTTRNAFRFDFSAAVRSFGAWFGDVETRTDGFGRPAVIRFLDAAGNIIGQDVIIGTSTSAATQPVNCDSSPGGGDPTNLVGCGSKTTTFIGFVDGDLTPRIRSVILIVGDADAGVTLAGNPNNYAGSPEGGTEFLSTIGATLAATISAAPASISGRVVSSGGRGISTVSVSVVDAQTGSVRFGVTNTFGFYTFNGLAAGNDYVVSIRHKRYSFEPSSVLVNLTDDLSGVNFTSVDP